MQAGKHLLVWKDMYVCPCWFVFVACFCCVYVCVYVYMCLFCLCVNLCWMYGKIYVFTCVYACVYVDYCCVVCVEINTCIVCVEINISFTHTYIHTYIHTYNAALLKLVREEVSNAHREFRDLLSKEQVAHAHILCNIHTRTHTYIHTASFETF